MNGIDKMIGQSSEKSKLVACALSAIIALVFGLVATGVVAGTIPAHRLAYRLMLCACGIPIWWLGRLCGVNRLGWWEFGVLCVFYVGATTLEDFLVMNWWSDPLYWASVLVAFSFTISLFHRRGKSASCTNGMPTGKLDD
jgi:hypothetical protein